LGALLDLQYTGGGEIVSAARPANNLSTSGELLLARYDLARIAATVDRDALYRGPSSLWRYAPLLPVEDPDQAVTLGEGWTPLVPALRLGTELGIDRLLIKDEGRNPSGTFKDRGTSVAVSKARELGIRTAIHNSSGNAAGSWGLYSARAGLRCVNIVPPDTLPASLFQSTLSGAVTVVMNGRWQDSGAVVAAAVKRYGWFNVGTLREPYRVEGKKTMGFEICEQLDWRVPDVVVYPAGGGLGAIAIYKAFDELEALGWIEKGRRPRLVITQYTGCAPIVRAFREGRSNADEWPEVDVLPGGLKSPRPGGAKAVLELVRATRGTCIEVSSEEALRAAAGVAATEGIFMAPESATTVVGLRKAISELSIGRGDNVVLMATGAGIKSVQNFAPPALIRINAGEELVLDDPV
jgi:threonine synthase